MKIKKSILAAGAITALGLGSFVGLKTTQAATTTAGTSLIDRLVSKFNLNKDAVQAVFNEDRQAKMAAHEQAWTTRLAQAVTDGKLTQAQVDLLTAKQKELQAATQTRMADLTKWAQDNNIPLQYLMMGPRGMGGGHHRFRGMGWKMHPPATTPTPSPAS